MIPKPALHTGILLSKEMVSSKVLKITLSPQTPFEFLPGQFININVKNGKFRMYSLASDAGVSNKLELLVSVAHEGLGSNFLKSAKVGDKIEFIGPSGRFFLRPLTSETVFVATGTGIAPFITYLYSIKHSFETADGKRIRLFAGYRTEDEILCLDLLNEFKRDLPDFDYTICLSNAANPNYKLGRVTQHYYADSFLHAHFYLCGNPSMVEDLTADLTSKGVPTDHIFFEKYTRA